MLTDRDSRGLAGSQPAAATKFDVTTLSGRRASNRWDRVSVGDILERVTWSTPDAVAIIGMRGAFADERFQRVTYRFANDVVNRVANALRAAGLARGDRVIMFCENSVEGYLTKLGIAKAGLVAVPVNHMLAPDVIEHIIRLVDPRFAIVDSDLWQSAKEAFAATGLSPGVTISIDGKTIPGSMEFGDFIAGHPATEPDVEISGDDIWEILFTSGTTAMPKAVMISHTYTYLAAYSFALSVTRGLKFESELRQCTCLPVIYHVGDHAFVLPAFFCAGSVVIGRRHSAPLVAEAVTHEQVTAVWAGSPQFLAELVGQFQEDGLRYDASSLTVVMYGWAALPPGVYAALKRLSGNIAPLGIFGQTEAIACHRFWPELWIEKFRRESPARNLVGLPPPILGSAIVNADGQALAASPGVAGEAVYRSPVMTAGYYKNLEATEVAFRDGWFHGGDNCEYDEDGLRIIVDRFKDIVKSGGENVSSLRVEAILNQHPAVQEAAVVGLPHERWGEAVTGVVIRTMGASVTSQELVNYCRQRLAGFETPKLIVFVSDLPVAVGGKVQKFRLREQLGDLYGSESEASRELR